MKNLEKLVQTGQWYWRDNEISYKAFQSLDKAAKDAHIEFLLSLDKNDRGTNDEYILRFFAPKEVEKIIHFFSIENICAEIDANIETIFEDFENKTKTSTENVQVCAPISDINIPTVEELIEMGEEYVHLYLNTYFELDYPDWETNVRFHDVDKFISSTKNFMIIDELTDVHIRAYKLIKSI